MRLLWAARDLTDAARLSERDLAAIEDVDLVWPAIDYSLFTEY